MNVTVSLDKPTTINGEGPTVIWLSDIPEGWLVAESRAEVGPEEFFVLTAETADRAIVDIVAITEPGESYQGSSVIDRFASGLVTTLVVEGLSGPWELTIVSGDLIEPLQSPVVVEGVGDMAFVVAGYPSTAVVSGNKDGDRTFTFSAFGPDRTRQTGLVHDGRELSSVVVELPDNMSLYHVKCESSWTIEFD